MRDRVKGLVAVGLRGLAIGGLLWSGFAPAETFDYVRVHTWDTRSNPDLFPERDDPRVSVPWLAGRPAFGIAFSGGGTRSAAATLGELRALDLLGWIDKARYISANSGGSWTVWPFSYLPAGIDDNVFLGPYIPPKRIDDGMLDPETDKEKDRHAMSSAIYRSKVGMHSSSVILGDEAYADVIGSIFLEPFGLHDRKRVFTFHDKALRSVLAANADEGLKATDFYRVERERPYPIVVGSLRVPKADGSDENELYLLEATPLYTGVRGQFRAPSGKKRKPTEMLIGGGYVESFGYDSYEPKGSEPEGGLWRVRLEGDPRRRDLLKTNERYRFTLSDVIGMSGAAPSIRMAGMHLDFEIFPDFRHWAVDRKEVLKDDNLREEAKELIHGDGGDIDNLALMPLLARQVENVLVFVNTRTPFSAKKVEDCGHITTDVLVDDVISLFRPEGKLRNNVVFREGPAKLEALCRGFVVRKAAGEPLVFCDRYTVLDNPRQSVRNEGYRPAICWVYLDLVKKWNDALDPNGGKKTADLKNQRGDFERFPHFRTFGEKKAMLIDMNRERVHALSNLTAWSVLESKGILAKGMRGASLPTDRASAD